MMSLFLGSSRSGKAAQVFINISISLFQELGPATVLAATPQAPGSRTQRWPPRDTARAPATPP